MSEKTVVRTESAPAPFQGAPYSQAIVAGGLVFVAGQVGLRPGHTELVGDGDRRADRAGVRQPGARSSRRPGSGLDRLVKTTVFLDDFGDFAAMNEVYARRSATGRPRARPSRWRRFRPARRSRSRRSRSSERQTQSPGVKAPEVIATHANTDFDAFASMLAARRLYPDAVVALPGSLNRNVREFYRLHADELDAVEASRLELDAIRRLIVVETTSRVPARRARAGRARPERREGRLRPSRAASCPEWVTPENAVVSEDGALTTTLVGILAEREIAVTPLEATAFALGIHEDTGSLTYPTATQRDADALALVPAARRAPGPARALPPHAARRRGAGAARRAASPRSRPSAAAGVERARRRRRLAAVRRRRLEPRPQDRRPHRLPRARRCSSRWTSASSASCAAGRRSSTRPRSRRASAAAGTRRRPRRSSAGRSAERASELARRRSPAAVREPLRAARRHVHGRPGRSRPDETVAAAMVALPAPRPERHPRRRRRPPRRRGRARGSRQGDRPRPLARAGQGDHERAASVTSRAEERRSASCSSSLAGSADGRVAVARGRPARRRRHAQRRAPRARRAAEPPRPSAAATSPQRARWRSSGSSDALRGGRGRQRALRRRLPRRRHRARHPARRAELRRRHRGRGRRDRARAARSPTRSTGASGRTRSSAPPSSLYGDGERVDVVTARTEFYDAPARAADGRARVDPRGPLPPRLHDQRDGRLAEGRGLRPAGRPVRRPARPRGGDDPRPPQPLVHRRPDADLPGDPLREPLRVPDGRAHAAARARLRSRWGSSATSRRRGCATS